MKVLLFVAAALLLAPLAAAQPSLQGELTATAVQATSAVGVDGKAAFIGFVQGSDQPDLGWSLRGEALTVDISTYTASTITPAYHKQSRPEHAIKSYKMATVEPTLSTKPAANAHEFWVMVTPPQSDQRDGFRVQGELQTQGLRALDQIYFNIDANHPAPESSQTPQDGSGVIVVQYRSIQPVLEWKPASAGGAWTISGDFVFTIYQADFQVTGSDGQTDHYSTGDEDPGFTVFNPVYEYKEIRADITVHAGTLTLLPNGRAMQLDFSRLSATAHGGVDFVDARGMLALPTGERRLEGQVHLEADTLTLNLAPRGSLVASAFSGTLNSVAVDGEAVPIPASTATTTAKVAQSLFVGLLAGFSLAAVAFTLLIVRKKQDQALLLARAQAFFEVGRYRAALRASRRLLRLHPADVDATTVAAMSLVRLGRPQDAKPLLERGLAAGAEHKGLLCMVEALVLFHEGNPSLAAQRLQEGFNTYPALNDELAAVDLLDQLLLHASPSSDPSPHPQAVSP